MPIGRGVLGGKPVTAAGQRDKQVKLEQLVESNSGSGFPMESWTTLAPVVWMSRRDLRADERFASSQESAFLETQWHMEYRPDMDPDVIDVPKTRRIVYQARVYNIRSSSVIGNYEGVELITLGS